MKKLMIVMAVALCATAMQAATVQWALTSKDTFKMQDGSSAKGITVYILNTAGSDYSSLLAGVADGSKTAADVASSASLVESRTTGTSNAQAGKIGSGTSFIESTITGAGLGESYSLAFLVFDTTSDPSKTYYYLSSTQTAKGYGGSGDYIAANSTAAQWTSSNAGGTWTEVASVPEPTSGLLMLVGLGALALRRRRA